MTKHIIDTHVHIFDTSRPQGIPWPPTDNPLLYQTTLPDQIKNVSRSSGVTGAVVVECSSRHEDNLWALEKVEGDSFIKGFIGNLDPEQREFPFLLEELKRYETFKGLRYGNLWNRDLGRALENPLFIDNLKRLPRENLVLDTANPTIPLLSDVIKLSDLIPDLTIIIDHLPALERPTHRVHGKEYDKYLKQLSGNPHIYVKVSAVLHRRGEEVPKGLSFYREKLNEIYDLFGPDRLLYGSDWPNSKPLGSYSDIFNVVHDFFQEKGKEICEKYFSKNAMKAYHIKEKN
jgi:L-fuconolactonase